MKTLLEAIILLFIIKGLIYFFFPVWIQRIVSEIIITLPVQRLKWLGVLMIFIGLFIWIFITNKMPDPVCQILIEKQPEQVF